MTLQTYLDSIKHKQVTVLGIGVSNTPLIKILCRAGIQVTARDQRNRDALEAVAEELESLGVSLILGEDYLQNLQADIIFRTPGIHPDLPEIQAAMERGAVLTSEMELFFEVCPCHMIAVTGSDGKTTTTTIIAKLLERAGKNVFLGGNIGRPLLSDVADMEPEDYAVLELSSFQLMTMEKSAEIAVVTNVTPNHLDVHTDMDEYIAAKENIFTHQDASGTVILNCDNSITRNFAESAEGQVILFSREQILDKGIYLSNNVVMKDGEPILPIDEIRLPGMHNVENYMAAIGAVSHLVPTYIIRAFAQEFGGVEHRIELVRVKDGVSYYNDSIASSPARTIAGLHSFQQKVILIAGGYDKKIPFEELGVEIAMSVKALYLNGDTAEKIEQAVKTAVNYSADSIDIHRYQTFEEAVKQAAQAAEPGDVVLLSPACASFDQFKHFAQRGETFKRLIYEL